MTIRFDSSAGLAYNGGNLRIEEIRVGTRLVKALAELGDKQTVEHIAEHLGVTRQTDGQQPAKAERDGLVKRQDEPSEGPRKPRDLWVSGLTPTAHTTFFPFFPFIPFFRGDVKVKKGKKAPERCELLSALIEADGMTWRGKPDRERLSKVRRA